MSIVEMKRSAPLTDIPSRLRLLAEQIEKDVADGTESPEFVSVVAYYGSGLGDFRVFGYGRIQQPMFCAGVLLGAANWLAVSGGDRPAPPVLDDQPPEGAA
jgi:hypothetical protein